MDNKNEKREQNRQVTKKRTRNKKQGAQQASTRTKVPTPARTRRNNTNNNNKKKEKQQKPTEQETQKEEQTHVVGRDRRGRVIPRQCHRQVLARIAHVNRVVPPLFRPERVVVVEHALLVAGRRYAGGQLHRSKSLSEVQHRHPLHLSVCAHP